MFLVDLEQGRIIHDDEIKESMAARQPYGRWLKENQLRLADLPPGQPEPAGQRLEVDEHRFGYTAEDLKLIIGPMAESGLEPTGSMGDDIPLAILSKRPRLLYDYFRQLFAQVTNPPLDAIREKLVTALSTTIGREHNLFAETPVHCRQLHLPHPILTPADTAAIRTSDHNILKSADLSICWPQADGGPGLTHALEALCRFAVRQVEAGAHLLILTDRDIPDGHAPIPAPVGHRRRAPRSHCRRHANRMRPYRRDRRSAGDPPLLLPAGLRCRGRRSLAGLSHHRPTGRGGPLDQTEPQAARRRYIGAVKTGILKVLSKMGISTLQSYRGAQIFECVGLNPSVTDRWFSGTVSRIGGADMQTIAREIKVRCAGMDRHAAADTLLPAGGRYQWRRDGEAHQYNPATIPLLQQAVRQDDEKAWRNSPGRRCTRLTGKKG